MNATAEKVRDILIERQSPVPLHHQISTGIEALIRSGNVPPGDVLPPVTEISRMCHVSYATAVRAIGSLARDGLVTTKRGQGTYVMAPASPTTEILVSSDIPTTPDVAASFYQQLVDGLSEGYGEARRRFQLTYASPASTPTEAELVGQVALRCMDGIVAHRPWLALRESLRRASAKTPCVSLFAEMPGTAVDSVLVDPDDQIRAMVHGLMARGARRFAYVGGASADVPEPWTPHVRNERAYLACLSEQGIVPDRCTIPPLSPEVPVLSRGDIVAKAAREFAEGLEDGAVLYAQFPSMLGQMDDHFGRLHVVSYTECRGTLERLSRDATFLYLGLEVMGHKAVPLLRSRRSLGLSAPGRTVTVAPVLCETWGRAEE